MSEKYSFVSTETAEEIRALIRERDALLAALQGLYADQVDYLTLNHLGGLDNHWMKAARAAIAQAREPAPRGCGCKHDGTRWLTMCAAAKAASDAKHWKCVLEHAADALRSVRGASHDLHRR
jgi:hypothetical protein